MQEKIEIHDTIESIEEEWEELAIRVNSPPFGRPGWFVCWMDAFGSGSFSALSLRREGRVVGVLPVLKRHGKVVSPTNWHTPGYGAVAIDAAAEAGLFTALFSESPRRVALSFLTAESSRRLHEVGVGRGFASRVIARSPYVAIDESWDSYWGSLSSNHRGNVRRRRRRLAELGEIAVDVSDGREGCAELLAEGLPLEASGWKGERGTAIASSPQTRRFYEGLCAWASEVGLFCFASLRVNGRMVAFNLSLETADAHYLLKLGHDVELASASPGTLLTAAMIERAFSLGMKSYEFLGDADPYKLRWTQRCREFVQAQSFAHTPTGLIDQIAQTEGRAIARRLTRWGRR